MLVHQEADDAVGRLAVHALPLPRARHLRIGERGDMQPSQAHGHMYNSKDAEGQTVDEKDSQEDKKSKEAHLCNLGQVVHKQKAARFD